jgi:hypothetical protein
MFGPALFVRELHKLLSQSRGGAVFFHRHARDDIAALKRKQVVQHLPDSLSQNRASTMLKSHRVNLVNAKFFWHHQKAAAAIYQSDVCRIGNKRRANAEKSAGAASPSSPAPWRTEGWFATSFT